MNDLKKNSGAGFSLVELMVAMTLGLILVLGVLQIFLGNRQTQRVEQSVSRVEESGRIAIDLLSQDLKMTGFFGCSKSLKFENNKPVAPYNYTPTFKIRSKGISALDIDPGFVATALKGYSRATGGTWSPNTLASDLTPSTAASLAAARRGSDVVSIYLAEATAANLAATATEGATPLSVNTNGVIFLQGGIYLVGNCKNTDMFTVTNSPGGGAVETLQHGTSANYDDLIGGTYPKDTIIRRLSRRTYYVADSGRKSPTGATVYSLFVSDGVAAQELVEGIEYMRVLYGQNMTPTAKTASIRFVPAGTAGLIMGDVVSVKIALLSQSSDSVRDTNDTASYVLLDRTISSATSPGHAADRSLRRVFSSVVELRNRMEQ